MAGPPDCRRLDVDASPGAYAADKIGVTMPNIKGPWFTPVLFGITDEAKKLDYEVIIQDAGGYGNVDKQVSQLSNLLVQKVKAILLDPANPDSFNGVVRQAKCGQDPGRRRRQPDRSEQCRGRRRRLFEPLQYRP